MHPIKPATANTSTLRRDLLLLLLLLVPLFTATLNLRPLAVPDEGRYPEIAREMLLSGDFITPRVNGVVFLDKPPLYYWFEAASMHLFGVHTWSIRLPPALFGIAGVLIIFVTARRLFSRRAAWLGAAVLATNPLYFLTAQYADMNIEIAVLVTLALCSFMLGIAAAPGSAERRRWLWLGYAAMGFGMLTKGLIGVVFPAMIVGAWLLLRGPHGPSKTSGLDDEAHGLDEKWRELRRWHIGSGVLLMLAISVPWFVIAQHRNPQLLQHFFINQQFERFTGNGFNNEFPFWFYPPVILLGLLPWSLWLPVALRDQWRAQRGDTSIQAQCRRILLLWPLLILAFFSIPSSKIAGYIVPVVPPLALLLGDYFARRQPAVAASWRARLANALAAPSSLRWIAASGLVLTGAVLIGVVAFNKTGAAPLASVLRHEMTPADAVISYRNYYQDLPIYLRTSQPLTVVDDWRDTAILTEDSWRREFYLGLQQQPEANDWLIDETRFAGLLHGRAEGQRIFVLARARDEQRLLERYPLTVLSRFGKQILLATPKADAAISARNAPDRIGPVQYTD